MPKLSESAQESCLKKYPRIGISEKVPSDRDLRSLRFVPAYSMVEVTTLPLQGRRLLNPSPELTDIILGVIGKAQYLYGMAIHAFVVLSTHTHFLLSTAHASKLASFMQFVNAYIAKQAERLHLWRERLWSRRLTSARPASRRVHGQRRTRGPRPADRR
jgi:hypothetical protein